ncbi:MAG: SapC family protein [Sphingobium sp.]|nr:SapC family protein [Sphingobium sp.]
MASAPRPELPFLYKDLVPLNAEQHRNYRLRMVETAPYLHTEHVVPLTVDEFASCQRFLPIVFSAGENPVPLALMGLNEGVNTMVDAEGKLRRSDGYVPAYIRRYPWMLARLNPASEELSLCFDPTVDNIGEFEDGERLINDDGTPTDVTKEVLSFAEQFEQAARRTSQFMTDLIELELLMDGECNIQWQNNPNPFVYRGFQMINEDKLRELRGDQLRKLNQNGMLPLLHAHLFSLQGMREIFGKQQEFGLGPLIPEVQPA